MPTILITTDFSSSSRHALDYACLLFQGKEVTLDLVHVFILPITYTADALSLTAMGNAMSEAEDALQEELAYVTQAYSAIRAIGRIITGSFLETLREEVKLVKPKLLILGTAGFTDLYFGNDDPLNALRSLPIPVLFIPRHAALKVIGRIAYACNYAGVGVQTPVRNIIDWVTWLGASLLVLHTDPGLEGNNEQQMKGQHWLQGQLSPLNPSYHWVQDADVLHGVTHFVLNNNIDCVMIVPKKYGMWENLFRQSRTKALARLNQIPIMAFPSNPA